MKGKSKMTEKEIKEFWEKKGNHTIAIFQPGKPGDLMKWPQPITIDDFFAVFASRLIEERKIKNEKCSTE